jgi:hypothetical protein
MLRITVAAAALLLLAGAAQAQTPTDVPKHKCDPKPQLPGARMMQEGNTAKNFQREVDAFRACMKAYADERAAAAKAHTEAGNAAITEYNDTMKALQEAQKSR